ncbi:hypothetical protein FQN50_000317 [Emmonsiellopsis sp. PD_5]|nr:hypothetical protein FQN50_000317 [Emmonsiellopsis sp. PD_5]
MEVALDSPVNVERPAPPTLPRSPTPDLPQSSQSSQSVMPPSSPFHFHSSPHTSAPDRPLQQQQQPPPTADDSHPVSPPPQPVPEQPVQGDPMDITPDTAHPQPVEPSVAPVAPTVDAAPAPESDPSAMETEQTSSAEAENVAAVDSTTADSTPMETEQTSAPEAESVPAVESSTSDSTPMETEQTSAPEPENAPAVDSTTSDSTPLEITTTEAVVESDPAGHTTQEASQPSSQETISDNSTPEENNASQDTSTNNQDSPPVEEEEPDKPTEEHAYWAEYEEDTSSPDEAELKEIESSSDGDYSALDYDYWEKSFYRDVDDPEYKPAEKARLTWKFKGVRGTKEKPNRATIMRSPAAYIGGIYWTIKFFPRGNNVNSLSIYIECSPTPPPQDKEIPATEFKVVKGPPSAVLSELTPDVDISLPATADSSKSESAPAPVSPDNEKQEPLGEATTDSTSTEPAAAEADQPPTPDANRDWRVSAQIGVILYNPDEPRTTYMQSSCHQFNSHNVDWGWTTFHGPWEDIHKRSRLQRQALLRNDTLAFDAYIRIFDDPTQSLWWHSSETEPIWDSLSLTGYRPMGDSMVNHSPEVAGLVSWLLLAPFREIVQSVDILEHLTNPNVKPRPLCEALQKFLWALRNQNKSYLSVDTDAVTQTLRNLHEFSGDVMGFWERVRRSLELELEGTDALEKLSKMFDGQKANKAIPAPPEPSTDMNHFKGDFNPGIRVRADVAIKRVESAVKQYLGEKPGKWSLPAVLHVELARHRFDRASHQWNMLYDRVGLDEELDLSDSVVETETGKYSLYGFVVHKGKRTSGQFYSILRPGGPGSRWLAFEDASDNKVECLTRKVAIDEHEGINVDEFKVDHRSGRDVAVIVMYVRNDVLPQYLTGKIESWEVPEARKHYFENFDYTLNPQPTIAVEVYSLQDTSLVNNSLFDSYDLMNMARSTGGIQHLTLPDDTSFADLRKKLALWYSKEDKKVQSENIRLWMIGQDRTDSGKVFAPNPHFQIIHDLRSCLSLFQLNVLRLWVHVLDESDAKLFALPDPAPPSDAFERPTEETEVRPEEPEAPENQDPASTTEPNVLETQDVGMGDPDSSSTPTQVMDIPTDSTSSDQPAERAAIESAHSDQPAEPVQSESAMETEQNETTSPPEETAAAAVQQDSNEDTSGDVQMTDAQPDSNPSEAVQAAEAETNPTVQSDGSSQENTTQSDDVTSDTQNTDPPEPSGEIAMDLSGNAEESNETPATPPAADNTATENTATVPVTDVAQGDLVMQDTHSDEFAVSTPTESPEGNPSQDSQNSNEDEHDDQSNPTPVVELVPYSNQVYYFVQYFDPEKQELQARGAYFAKRDDTIKSTIRAALGWSNDKQFLLWHRVDGISIVAVSSTDLFETVLPTTHDGECFVVGEVLPKAECTKLSEAGSFATPDRLVQYLWALSRRHPSQAYTGTKTVDATFNSDYYSGDFKKGYYHGKGTHISDSGATYTGDFVLGQRHGQGNMEFATGDTYSGDWVEDQRHGQGTFIERKTGNKYVGGYRDGKRHGKGVSYWEVADEEMDLCQICYSEDQDALFYSCGHVCACVSCAKQVDICPMCRKKVVSVVKIYRS